VPACLAAGVLLLYSIDLGRAPIYLHPAEVLFALQAHAIATTAHDLGGRLLPVYFHMAPIGENVWFQPVIEYFTAPFFWVLPITEWAVRIPSVIVGAIDVVLAYFVALRLFGEVRWAVVPAVLLALTPSHFIHSRVAMDYLYPVPFVLAWLLLLLRYLDERRTLTLWIATTILGVGVYSYIASAIMMPVYLALTWLMLFVGGERRVRTYVIAASGFWPVVIGLAWIARHPGILDQTLSRYQTEHAIAAYDAAGRLSMSAMMEELRRPVHFFDVTGRVSLYWYFFDPSYLFLTGGYANIMDSTRRVGVFLAPLIVFVPAGIAYLAGGVRERGRMLLLLGLLTAPLAAVLVVPEPYAVDRELELLPFAVLIGAFGVRALMRASNVWLRRAAVALMVAVPLHFAFLCYDYWRDYPLRAAYWFGGNNRAALEMIIDREPPGHASPIYFDRERLPYIDAYWRFYVLKKHREDLLTAPASLRAGNAGGAPAPAGSLWLARADDTKTIDQRSSWRRVAVFPEPGSDPLFALFER
jgi:4-amino-4-deoxy-L-arabinose transferase-like glycosyltransferase